VSYLYVDIETLPSADPVEPVLPAAPDLDTIGAAGNLKDPDKIAASIADRRAKAVADYVAAKEAAKTTAIDEWAKGSLDPLRGRIASIAWAHDGNPVRCMWALDDLGAVLDAILADLTSPYGDQWVGHNVAGFDLRWLKLHALRIKHPIAKSIPYQKWDKRVIDTMEAFAGPNPTQARMSQASLARFFGIAVDTDSGSEVRRLYEAGDIDAILRHNAEDVEIVRKLHTIIRGL
jgi:hypothetical protein